MNHAFEYVPIAATTWAYLSSLLMLALFFKFNRFWSVRNFDLFLIILLAPGLLLVQGGQLLVEQHEAQESIHRQLKKIDEEAAAEAKQTDLTDAPKDTSPSESNEESGPVTEEEKEAAVASIEPDTSTRKNTRGHVWQRWGFYWLFAVGALLLIRMLIDPSLARRPLLEPNLSIGGLVFFGFSLMIFLLANIATSEPTDDDLQGAKDAIKLIQREAAQSDDLDQLRKRGPGYRLFNLLPIIPSFENGNEILETDVEQSSNLGRYVIAAKSLAIGSQLLIVVGLILFCYYNYNSFEIGVCVSTIYLMLPYTASFTGHVLHSLPAGLLIWALVCLRRPRLAGILVGLATGVSYYPIFLLPLWISFYWERGAKRFCFGFIISITICVCGLLFSSVDAADFLQQLREMFGFWQPIMSGLEGIWALGWNQWWRLPLLVAFVLFCGSFAAWPTEKNIGTLISYTAAIMLALQFWHGFGGGLYMAWYLPMVLLTIFRPNLKGRIAVEELKERIRPKKETAEDLLPVT